MDRRTVLTAEPLGSRPGADAGGWRARPSSRPSIRVSGAVREATFVGNVAFTEPGRKAWAGRAVFDEAAAS